MTALALRRLYVTADQRTVVLEDSPDAAFLLCAVGQPLPSGLEDTGEGDPPQFPRVVEEPAADDVVVEEPAAKKRAGRHTTKPED